MGATKCSGNRRRVIITKSTTEKKKKYDKEITTILAIYQTTCGSIETGRCNILYRSSKEKGQM